MPPLSHDTERFRPLYQGADPVHDFHHALRVARIGADLARAEGACVETVRLAALLHDVPHGAYGRETHEEGAAARATEFLTACGQDEARIAHVRHCILAHRFRRERRERLSLEAQCLFDADKLDSLGAVGIARMFAYAGLHGHALWPDESPTQVLEDHSAVAPPDTPAREWQCKLRWLADSLHTPAGRRRARPLHRYMADFMARMQGECQAPPAGTAPTAATGDAS